MKKGMALALNTIVIAIVVLIIMVIMIMISTGGTRELVQGKKSCVAQGGLCREPEKCRGDYRREIPSSNYDPDSCPSGQICCAIFDSIDDDTSASSRSSSSSSGPERTID